MGGVPYKSVKEGRGCSFKCFGIQPRKIAHVMCSMSSKQIIITYMQWSCQQSKSRPDHTEYSEWQCVTVSNVVLCSWQSMTVSAMFDYKEQFGEV